jgi:hypothetical protein
LIPALAVTVAVRVDAANAANVVSAVLLVVDVIVLPPAVVVASLHAVAVTTPLVKMTAGSATMIAVNVIALEAPTTGTARWKIATRIVSATVQTESVIVVSGSAKMELMAKNARSNHPLQALMTILIPLSRLVLLFFAGSSWITRLVMSSVTMRTCINHSASGAKK